MYKIQMENVAYDSRQIGRARDMSGKTFYGFTVLMFMGVTKKSPKSVWKVRCNVCDREICAVLSKIASQKNSHCGCKNEPIGRITHGMTNSRVYRIWTGMKRRCLSPRSTDYDLYGGLGVKISEKWINSFEEFYKDMGDPPTDSHTLDRFPNKFGNYEASNCRWATWPEQANNRRNNIVICMNGESRKLSEWSAFFGVKRGVIENRLKEKRPLDQIYRHFSYNYYKGKKWLL